MRKANTNEEAFELRRCSRRLRSSSGLWRRRRCHHCYDRNDDDGADHYY